jgi:erythrin-vacuolar iron transport family protein
VIVRRFENLSPQEVLALAVRIEQCNARRLRAFADVFRGQDESVAARFEELAVEEEQHEQLLADEFRRHFGAAIPLLEEAEVEGVIESVDLDDGEHLLFASLDQKRVYDLMLRAEQVAQRFYARAEGEAKDPRLKALYGQLARIEGEHAAWVVARRG